MEIGYQTVINGEHVLLLPQRALFWKAEASLILGDLHIGKDVHFRKQGIGIPNTGVRDLERLSKLIQEYQARKVYLLGDVYHTKQPGIWQMVDQWVQMHPFVQFHLIRGNHDRGSLTHSSSNLLIWEHSLVAGPFCLQHEPPLINRTGNYILSGHLHPCVTIRGNARMRVTLPAFIFKSGYGIIPAFGSFTGNAVVEVQGEDQVFAIADNRIIAIDPSSLKSKSHPL